MSKPHVLSFAPNGSVEFTRSPDLNFLFKGEGDMERVTDIRKRTDAAMFYVHWMLGPFAGEDSTHVHHSQFLGEQKPCVRCRIEGRVMLFWSYEDAVKYEVQMLDAMRKAGVQFGTAHEQA